MIYLIHPPANKKNAFFYYPARGYNRHPRITTEQISKASLGCKVAKLRGQMGWNLYVSIVWEGCVSYKIWQLDNLAICCRDYSYNEVWAIQITGVLPEVNVANI